jgi:hypothetical protein
MATAHFNLRSPAQLDSKPKVKLRMLAAVPTETKNDGVISQAVAHASIGATFDGNPGLIGGGSFLLAALGL